MKLPKNQQKNNNNEREKITNHREKCTRHIHDTENRNMYKIKITII